jgi:hypothetical protein
MPALTHRKKWLSAFLFLLNSILHLTAQKPLSLPPVAEFKWSFDYDIYLKMANDSSYTFDIRTLFHIKEDKLVTKTDYILYPVNLGEEYVNGIAAQNNDSSTQTINFKTLWSALHSTVGGGWVHFNNCLLYALETNYLSLKAPLMKRPDTKWKPKPLTQTYLRTRKWDYYIPVKQKEAHKEYRIRQKNNELGDMKSIPQQFIDLFLSTTDNGYKKLQKKQEYKKLAQIDLVKIMLGANYLSEPQILYIRSAVLNAVKNYSANKLPAVVIFDRFDAAAIMTLSLDGYKIEAIAFRNANSLSATEAEERRQHIQQVIDEINTYNRNQFIKRLMNYYSL